MDELREGFLAGVLNLVTFLVFDPAVFNVNISVLSVGFRLTLSRQYSAFVVGAAGASFGLVVQDAFVPVDL